MRIRPRASGKTIGGGKVTLRIGAAAFPGDDDDADAIIAIADEALDQAKREGRDRTIRARRLAKTGT